MPSPVPCFTIRHSHNLFCVLFFRKDTFQTPGVCGRTTRMFICRKHLLRAFCSGAGHFLPLHGFACWEWGADSTAPSACTLQQGYCSETVGNGDISICEPGDGVPKGLIRNTHPACFLHHLRKVSLLFIFHSRNVVGDNPSFLVFCKIEVC